MFTFSVFTPRKEQGWDSRTHCFEGQLIARKDKKGNLVLVDTYWGLDGHNGRLFTPEEAETQGELRWYFNLDDVEPAQRYEEDYYDPADLFHLSTQNGCVESCRFLYKKKDARRSKEKMLTVINDKIIEARRKIESFSHDIERYSATKTKIELGDLSVYL